MCDNVFSTNRFSTTSAVMELCFYSRAMSLAAGTKCHPTTLRIAYKHTCLFIRLLLSAIPRWKDRFIGAWENCSRSRLREFCTNRRIMPQAQTYTNTHTHTRVPVRDRLWEQRSVLARNVESVWSMCNRISQPLTWSTKCFSVCFFFFFLHYSWYLSSPPI